MIQSEGEQKDTATTTTSAQDLSIQQKQVNKIVEEHKYILASPTGVPPHFPIKQSYNRSLHSSIGHNPFQVCLGFQPLAPIDIALHVASSLTESSHTQTKEDHATILVEWIQPLQQQVHDILQQANAKYKHDNFFSKEATHQGSDSTKASPSPMGT
jgi:hypothetical protein